MKTVPYRRVLLSLFLFFSASSAESLLDTPEITDREASAIFADQVSSLRQDKENISLNISTSLNHLLEYFTESQTLKINNFTLWTPHAGTKPSTRESIVQIWLDILNGVVVKIQSQLHGAVKSVPSALKGGRVSFSREIEEQEKEAVRISSKIMSHLEEGGNRSSCVQKLVPEFSKAFIRNILWPTYCTGDCLEMSLDSAERELDAVRSRTLRRLDGLVREFDWCLRSGENQNACPTTMMKEASRVYLDVAKEMNEFRESFLVNAFDIKHCYLVDKQEDSLKALESRVDECCQIPFIN